MANTIEQLRREQSQAAEYRREEREDEQLRLRREEVRIRRWLLAVACLALVDWNA